jgi:hypothetical protein
MALMKLATEHLNAVTESLNTGAIVKVDLGGFSLLTKGRVVEVTTEGFTVDHIHGWDCGQKVSSYSWGDVENVLLDSEAG